MTPPIELKICCKQMENSSAIEQLKSDGSWAVNGCCGCCYVLTDIKFCPFCGEKLQQIGGRDD